MIEQRSNHQFFNRIFSMSTDFLWYKSVSGLQSPDSLSFYLFLFSFYFALSLLFVLMNYMCVCVCVYVNIF
jgi:hypothetical protein